MTYRSGFFDNRRGQRLFYAEHLPDRADAAAPVWIVCSPILEEKNVSQGAMVTVARAIAASSARALRVDYEGHGDSGGDTGPLDLTSWAEDIADAAAFVRRDGATSVSLIGCRVGAMLAAMAAPACQADRVIAWSPVLSGADYVQELLRMNLTTQMAIHQRVVQNREAMTAVLESGAVLNVLGWDMGEPLYRSLLATTFEGTIRDLTCPVDVLELVRRKTDAAPAPVAALAAPPRVQVRAVPGMQFWIDGNFLDVQQKELIAATIEISAGASVG